MFVLTRSEDNMDGHIAFAGRTTPTSLMTLTVLNHTYVRGIDCCTWKSQCFSGMRLWRFAGGCSGVCIAISLKWLLPGLLICLDGEGNHNLGQVIAAWTVIVIRRGRLLTSS
ncbi:unnamed protein product [Discosporangium mesarthrocarpum]